MYDEDYYFGYSPWRNNYVPSDNTLDWSAFSSKDPERTERAEKLRNANKTATQGYPHKVVK